MRNLSFILCFFFTTLFLPVQASTVSPFVVGGSNASIEDAPWQVLVWGDNKRCGGVLIASEWVLTAAHCLDQAGDNEAFSLMSPSSVSVYTGTADISISGLSAFHSSVEALYVYDTYNKDIFDGDIALIKLVSPVSTNARPVMRANTLAQKDFDATGDISAKNLLLSGWGYTDEDRTHLTDILQKATLSLVSDETCADLWGLTLLRVEDYENKFVCAQDSGIGACNGDSGGPLIWNDPSRAADPDGGATLVGLVSFGVDSQCASDLHPDVYTQISTYNAWIDSCIEGQCITPIASQQSSGGGSLDFFFFVLVAVSLGYRFYLKKKRMNTQSN